MPDGELSDYDQDHDDIIDKFEVGIHIISIEVGTHYFAQACIYINSLMRSTYLQSLSPYDYMYIPFCMILRI